MLIYSGLTNTSKCGMLAHREMLQGATVRLQREENSTHLACKFPHPINTTNHL